MRRLSACCLLALVVPLAGCGNRSTPTPTPGGTALTVLAVNPTVGRALFHLRCSPPGGDLPNNASACRALTSTPALVSVPKPFACYGGTTSWWDITISGRLDGRRLHREVSTCWMPQMATLDRLGIGRSAVLESHLAPRRTETLFPGVPRSFPSGVMRPGDLVTCDIRGHHLETGVPSDSGFPESVGYQGSRVVTVTLDVARARDGTVTASCHDW